MMYGIATIFYLSVGWVSFNRLDTSNFVFLVKLFARAFTQEVLHS